MKKFLLAVFCLAGLLGCMNDDSTIDESSIVITRGNIRDVYELTSYFPTGQRDTLKLKTGAIQ